MTVVGAGSASRMLLYLSCPDLKPSDVDASLRELVIDRRHVSFHQLLVEGQCITNTAASDRLKQFQGVRFLKSVS